MNKNEKQPGSTCGDCAYLDTELGWCKKYLRPLPVNIDLEFLRGIQCVEDWRCNNESKSKT